ncbi:MAG TPA: septum formation initiator family protein [Gaiellaceae bacterium]|nr:septum formation initiator family protein [Gaiellaceae bacterium]
MAKNSGGVIRLRPTRLLALGGIVVVAFLYWKPLHTYLRTKHELDARRAEVHALRVEQVRLQRRLAAAGTDAQLIQEARRIGLVKPGERLFIVKGIAYWRKHH